MPHRCFNDILSAVYMRIVQSEESLPNAMMKWLRVYEKELAILKQKRAELTQDLLQ